MKKYLINLSLLILVIGIVFFFLSSKLADWQQNIILYILGYFTIVTFVSHLGLERTTKSRPQVFIRYYMASTTIRLLAHLVIIISYATLNPGNARFFIVVFMIMYFIFTVFEVMYVMKKKHN